MSRKRQEKRNQERLSERPWHSRYQKYEPPKPRVPPTDEERKKARMEMAQLLGMYAAMDIRREY
jgi:hypothetical protein